MGAWHAAVLGAAEWCCRHGAVRGAVDLRCQHGVARELRTTRAPSSCSPTIGDMFLDGAQDVLGKAQGKVESDVGNTKVMLTPRHPYPAPANVFCLLENPLQSAFRFRYVQGFVVDKLREAQGKVEGGAADAKVITTSDLSWCR